MKLIFHIGDDLAITVTAVLSQPKHYSLDLKTALLKKICRLAQCMVTWRHIRTNRDNRIGLGDPSAALG